MSKRSADYRQQFMKKNKGILGVYFCAYCKRPITASSMEVDHILPVSKVGINHTSNLVASCKECNRRKSDKIDHRVMLGFADKLLWAVVGMIVALLLGAIKIAWVIVKLPITLTAKVGKALILGKIITGVIVLALLLTVYFKVTGIFNIAW